MASELLTPCADLISAITHFSTYMQNALSIRSSNAIGWTSGWVLAANLARNRDFSIRNDFHCNEMDGMMFEPFYPISPL